MRKIYPCLTTLTKGNWEKQLTDINKYDLKEVAVFLTGIDFLERQKLYSLLKQSKIKYVPHLHLRSDMTNEEIDFFYKNYRTRQFNTHGNYLNCWTGHPFLKKYFLIETTKSFSLGNIKKTAGYTIDLAHLFTRGWGLDKLGLKEKVDKIIAQGILPKANHLSGLSRNRYDTHLAKAASYFDYLKKIDKIYLSKIICLELENSIKQQLIYLRYIQKIL